MKYLACQHFLFHFSLYLIFSDYYVSFMLIQENLWTSEACALGRKEKVSYNPPAREQCVSSYFHPNPHHTWLHMVFFKILFVDFWLGRCFNGASKCWLLLMEILALLKHRIVSRKYQKEICTWVRPCWDVVLFFSILDSIMWTDPWGFLQLCRKRASVASLGLTVTALDKKKM